MHKKHSQHAAGYTAVVADILNCIYAMKLSYVSHDFGVRNFIKLPTWAFGTLFFVIFLRTLKYKRSVRNYIFYVI